MGNCTTIGRIMSMKPAWLKRKLDCIIRGMSTGTAKAFPPIILIVLYRQKATLLSMTMNMGMLSAVKAATALARTMALQPIIIKNMTMAQLTR